MGAVLPASGRGQVMALVAIALVVLIGFVALAVDLGFLWGTKRKMQTAADAAALAGAVASRQGGDAATVEARADNVASLNGFTNGTNGVAITVTNPYTGGTCSASANCVRVHIQQPESTYFLRVLGFTTISVSASAASGTTNSGSCIYGLGPSSPGLTVTGTPTVSAACGVIVNTDAKCGGNFTIDAPIGVAGNPEGCPSNTVTHISDVPDPFAYLGSAPPPACPGGITKSNYNSSTTLSQGSYCNGIHISGTGTTITFNPGTYKLSSPQDLTIDSGSVVRGTGVTFIDSQGGININGTATVNLSAPTSGTYKGILFWDTSTANSSIAGASGSTFDGALYFPNSQLSYAGNSSSSGYTIIAADSVRFTGNTTLGDNYSSLGGNSPIQSSSLYE
jgi:hypothetical protein